MENTKSTHLMNLPGELRFTADGRWIHDGVEVSHEGIRDYFSRHLTYDPALGHHVVEVNGKGVAVTIEDTPVVVRTVDISANPWHLILSNGATEAVDLSQLEVHDFERWYALTRSGRARLTRAAVQAFLPHVEERPDGHFALVLFGVERLL